MVGLLGLAWRLLGLLGAGAAYRVVHGFPARLQGAAARLAGAGRGCPWAGYRPPGLGVELGGPVGLAAGLNKDGNLTWLGDAVCMGFTVVGSVLPRPYKGAERKILWRVSPGGAVNRLGLPSRGARAVLRGLGAYRPRYTRPVVNIAGLRRRDYPEAAGLLRGAGAWLEVNVSCPNTEEHGTFEDPRVAAEILAAARREWGGPVLLKIPRTTSRDRLRLYVEAARRAGAAGLVAGNTSKITVGGVQAGLSGAPVYWSTRRMVRVLLEEAPSRMIVVASGGVTRPGQALELLEMGAGLVEVLTVLLRHGPARAREIAVEAARWAGRR